MRGCGDMRNSEMITNNNNELRRFRHRGEFQLHADRLTLNGVRRRPPNNQ